MNKQFIFFAALLIWLSGCAQTNNLIDRAQSALAPAKDTGPAATPDPEYKGNPPTTNGPSEVDFYDVDSAAKANVIEKAPQATMFGGHRIDQITSDLQDLSEKHQLRVKEIDALQKIAANQLGAYYPIIGVMKSKLQSGTVPQDKELLKQWEDAKHHLDNLNETVIRMDALSKNMASAASVNSFLVEAIRAASTSPATSQKDLDVLAKLEKDAIALLTDSNQNLSKLNNAVVQNNATINTEQGEMTRLNIAIKNGWLYRPSLTNRILGATTASRDNEGDPFSPERKNPLIVIRFEENRKTDYLRPLQAAIHETLRTKPESNFDVIAVSTDDGAPNDMMHQAELAKNRAEEVVQTITNMGLPAERVTLSATRAAVKGSEVHIFIK